MWPTTGIKYENMKSEECKKAKLSSSSLSGHIMVYGSVGIIKIVCSFAHAKDGGNLKRENFQEVQYT